MPRHRIDHSRVVYVLPDDFPERLERFKEESGLTWAEIARRIGTYPLTIRRWRSEGVRPNLRHQMALLALAESLGLGHIFTDWGESAAIPGVRRPPRRGAPAGPRGFPARARRSRREAPRRTAGHR